MKVKNTVVASALLSLFALSAHAAVELTPQQAKELKPYERITITGRFNSMIDATQAISDKADSKQAYAFYIQDYNDLNGGGNWRVVADLYHKDAPKAEKDPYIVIHGVKMLPKAEAYALEPYDTVSLAGFYRSQPDINEAIASAAAKKGADGFFIVRQIDINDGGNQHITAFIYKADAPKRQVQSPDLIPANSEEGKALLAQGGEAAKKVEIPGIASSASPSRNVGLFFETQESTGKRYTVTLPDGSKIEELNNATAAQMTPFDTVTFSGRFNSLDDVAYEAAKQAADKGCKFYHLTRQWSNQTGGNLTVTAELFK